MLEAQFTALGCQLSTDGLYPGTTVIARHHKTVLDGTLLVQHRVSSFSRLMVIQSFPDSNPSTYILFSKQCLNHYLKSSHPPDKTSNGISYHSSYSPCLQGLLHLAPWYLSTLNSYYSLLHSLVSFNLDSLLFLFFFF